VCGLVAAAGVLDVRAGLDAIGHRGPDSRGIETVAGVTLGHVRLAVQDVTEASAQPFRYGPITLAYTGELFNAEAVRALLPGPWSTSGDTEVVAAALAGLEAGEALRRLDGMFALAWTDDREPGYLFLARDRAGEIPLHLAGGAGRPVLAVSEIKAARALGYRAVRDVEAGSWQRVSTAGEILSARFHDLRARPAALELDVAAGLLAGHLETAVDRRAVADVPICTLLSGGIDSAVIALELTRHVPDLVCYTARLDPRSRDLRCARETADMIGAKLIEVDVQPPTADDLAGVIAQIEMPFKAQVEIGWACLQLARAMRSDGFTVTYSGEGSDELWASYGFAYHGLQKQDWHTYRRDLILDQQRKNFPRVNKAFMASSIEARLPFLDPDVVDFALSLPREAVQDGKAKPKAVLQRAYAGRLPESVTSRPKVAFQDGLGLKANIAATLAEPQRFYRTEFARVYG